VNYPQRSTVRQTAKLYIENTEKNKLSKQTKSVAEQARKETHSKAFKALEGKVAVLEDVVKQLILHCNGTHGTSIKTGKTICHIKHPYDVKFVEDIKDLDT
jgi:hypothetical protein